MYSNTKFEYNYDIDVLLKDAKTGAKLKKICAREVATQNFDAAFASGGIASGGQSYCIATNSDLSQYQTGAYSIQAVIDGTEYKVASIQSNISATKKVGVYKQKREYTLYLM